MLSVCLHVHLMLSKIVSSVYVRLYFIKCICKLVDQIQAFAMSRFQVAKTMMRYMQILLRGPDFEKERIEETTSRKWSTFFVLT